MRSLPFNGMPWYYFSLENGEPAASSEGDEFPDDQAALQYAKVIARDFARNETAPGSLRVVVRNESGTEIASVRLAKSSN